MIILKCILAGLSFLVAFVFLAPVAVAVIFALFVRREPGTTIGFDPVSIMRSFPVLWLVPILVFLLGSFWEYRRIRSR